ncbi:MAG: HpcH/HpaI aldolase/citrate lyase family protein [Methyloligellaceae bacterium]
MTTFRPRRSGLYMPGSNARALEKAKTLAADAVIFDLEDAVAPEAKAEARAQACAAVQSGGYGRRELVIRVNAMSSDWGEADVAAAAAARPDAILIPKVQAAGDLATVRTMMDAAGAPPDLALWAMMETPLAILNAHDIAAAAPANRYPLTVFVMGTNDLAKETRAELTADRQPVLAWLSGCVAAARAYRLDILDGVYNNFRDEEGLRRECEQGRALGMDGKTLIHPGQIGPCNEIFSPGTEEIDWSRKVLAAFAEPENRGKGVITVEGRMVELLHAEMARRTVAIAEAIEQLQAA